jgi:pilus assembly protein Flp/PilA
VIPGPFALEGLRPSASRGAMIVLPAIWQFSHVLIRHLLCARIAGSMCFCAIELTAPQSSDPRVTSTVAVLRTPARPYVSSTSHVDMEFNPMKNLIARFVKDESGATAIEYGLIAAGISVVIIVAVNGIGTTLNTKFEFISTKLQ